ncbi:hypothetical protein EDC31_11914 [Acidomonas methanolica]|nr:hypothetical protein EDC31_11914 [Acidomonas methanolica]
MAAEVALVLEETGLPEAFLPCRTFCSPPTQQDSPLA